MSAIQLTGIAAAATLFAVPALAAPMPTTTAANDPMAYPDQSAPPAARSATSAGVNTSGVVLLSSPTPPGQAYQLKAGDPTVISNAPIPDTRANRARYGGPMSNGGRRTAPIGN